MLFSELNLSNLLDLEDAPPETARGEIPEYLFWSTFCDLLERIEPEHAEDGVSKQSREPRS